MGNVNMEAYQVHYKGNKSVEDKLKEMDGFEQQIEDLSDIVSIKADRIDIAPAFSEENAYSAGDLVYQSGRLWQFTADHAEGAWDSSEVSAANVDIVRNELQEDIDELKNTIKQETVTVTKESGDTYGTILARLFSMVDTTKIKPTSKLVRGDRVYTLVTQSSTLLVFYSSLISVSNPYAEIYNIEVSAAPTFGAIVITPAQATIIRMTDYTSEPAPDALTIYY